MRPSGYTVFIVDDDQSVRDALGLLLSVHGYPITLFADAESCLNAYRPDWRGCMLIDIRMPGMDGLALQKRLKEAGSTIPVIIMTGHGDVESAREAFRTQAVDFLEKPIDHAKLVSAIEESLHRQAAAQETQNHAAEFERLFATLTVREREVMKLVVAGHHNREIADKLGISSRTVEVHKARMMAKLRTASIPDLVRLTVLQRKRLE